MELTQKELQKAAAKKLAAAAKKLAAAAKTGKPIQVKIPREPVTIAKGGHDAYCIPSYEGQRLMGYTCLGFDVAMQRANGYYEWLKSEGVNVAPYDVALRGTIEGYYEYRRLLDRASAHNVRTGRKCLSELSPQLVGLEGQQVEVVTTYGETRRFIVGKSTGWCPIHLEIANRASSGGPGAEREYKSVRTV